MTTLYLLPVAFLLTFAICRVVIYAANRKQWLDHPNDRSSHQDPTPTGGGIGIVLGFILCFLAGSSDANLGFNPLLVLLPAVLVAGIGLADDFYSLGIWSRLSVQLIAVLLVLATFGLPVIPLPTMILLPGPVAFALAVFGFIWFINLFNFMDGIDGLAGAESLFFCLALYGLCLPGLTPDLGYFVLLLSATVAGFLVLNLAPARIFMGDVGSNFLGFMLVVISLSVTLTGLTNIWVCLILAGVFIVDATLTLISRCRRGEKWYFAHRDHAYQRATDVLESHGKVVVIITVINLCWLLPCAYLAHRFPGYGLFLLLLAWLPLAAVVTQSAKLSAGTRSA